MAARFFPVHASAAVVGVGLTGPVPAWIGPIRQGAGADPAEDLVEVGVADQECVVLGVDWSVVVGEVQGDVVVDLYHQERAVRDRLVQAQDLGQERRRLMLVADGHDGVVQLDGHGTPLITTLAPSSESAPRTIPGTSRSSRSATATSPAGRGRGGPWPGPAPGARSGASAARPAMPQPMRRVAARPRGRCAPPADLAP